ncbi:hypothetical protein ABIC63_000558 [Pseudacidovorax sp. 1753]|uniref:hypothetical protein n=1 Tax=Pseudacidovorax sp. 1753 TaxID=3156419 RepID=UPI003391A662
MKMAKPSERDIDAGSALLSLRNDLSSGYYPWNDGEHRPTYFDPDDRQHLRRLYDALDALLERAPGFAGRVIGGMCYVICWDRNQILDPADDCLALHPDLVRGRQLLALARADLLPRLEREARATLASHIDRSAAAHLAAMRASWGRPASPGEFS